MGPSRNYSRGASRNSPSRSNRPLHHSGNSSTRVVTVAGASSSLSSRFSQIERSRSNNNIGASSGNALRGGSGKVKKSRRGRHGGPTPMDIDRPTRSAPPSNNAGGDRPARKGYNGPNRRGDRGGKPKTPSRETLDMDLDNYMLKDTKVAKAVLDNELDAYMTQS